MNAAITITNVTNTTVIMPGEVMAVEIRYAVMDTLDYIADFDRHDFTRHDHGGIGDVGDGDCCVHCRSPCVM